jgi:hypothetical protein
LHNKTQDYIKDQQVFLHNLVIQLIKSEKGHQNFKNSHLKVEGKYNSTGLGATNIGP